MGAIGFTIISMGWLIRCLSQEGVQCMNELLNLRAVILSHFSMKYTFFNVWVRYFVLNGKGNLKIPQKYPTQIQTNMMIVHRCTMRRFLYVSFYLTNHDLSTQNFGPSGCWTESLMRQTGNNHKCLQFDGCNAATSLVLHWDIQRNIYFRAII